MRRLLSHLRSQAIGYLALFVALGGTAYAVSLPPNSVGTKQLKTSAVTTAKIAKDAVTTGKVQDLTLQAQDFAPGVLLRGPAGDTGPIGPQGPIGLQGPTGGVDTAILWAVVKGGTSTEPAVLKRGSHAVSVVRLGPGVTEVKFDRDISKCAYNVTPGGPDPIYSPGLGGPVSINVNPKGGASDTMMVGSATVPSGSVVALDGFAFHLIVAC
jgi:hypothetical protein